jgi:pimeloyl-ACP methyl ester carboxylesterase
MRRLSSATGLSRSRGRWQHIAIHRRCNDIVETFVETALGPAPAWLIDRGTDRWAIHVHGQGSTRAQTLRGVESASRMGLSSLVISYRNDGEGPPSGDNRSHLGESEWRDLEAALRFVAERGGTECVVFGWSLGATMALNTVQRSSLTEMIKGLILVSPVLVWEDVLRANARHQRCPQLLGSLIARLLALRGFSRLAGLEGPLEVRGPDRARFQSALHFPVLILHNRNDWSVPFETSARFAQAHKDRIELVEFDCSGHTQEWNSDPVGWDLAVAAGTELVPAGRRENKLRQTANEIDGLNCGWRKFRDRLERAGPARKVNLLWMSWWRGGNLSSPTSGRRARKRYELSRTRWWRIRSGESPMPSPKKPWSRWPNSSTWNRHT